ncbi:MAG: 2-amino-4-hydroxy-6-hydroxymethyldihydropteridine diphosphokinase [Fibrobacter sp.]|nr:2-amino-4-hydroxy-6-hydroxymethyldihydropteridine diphosphokinase [Fibrobacter sp.]
METLERVFIALGTNIPPRGPRLQEARNMLRGIAAGGWKESSIYETPAVGPEGQAPYFNQVVSFWYSRGKKLLLYYLKGAELLLGRIPRQERWTEREIDLDLLYYGDAVSTGRPTLPHPEIIQRQFVLVPMCDIAPDWKDPLTMQSMQELLSELQQKEGEFHFKKIEFEGTE